MAWALAPALACADDTGETRPTSTVGSGLTTGAPEPTTTASSTDGTGTETDSTTGPVDPFLADSRAACAELCDALYACALLSEPGWQSCVDGCGAMTLEDLCDDQAAINTEIRACASDSPCGPQGEALQACVMALPACER